MGLLDKIKNALFEVEYVEVEDKPKKEKKSKDETEEKPIAKKIVLPGKREEKVEEIQEEELKDEDFEIRPKDETIKEVFRDNFNVMDDDDFLVVPEEPPKEEAVVEEAAPAPQPIVDATPVEPIFAEPSTQPVSYNHDPSYADKDYVREYDSYKEKVYSTIHDDYRIKTRESRPYGMDPSYQVSIKEYGSENKDEKSYFRPSPIISPIYGILDKNYRKEDVVSKKEVRLTSSYARANVNVDDVRNKLYERRTQEEPILDEEVEGEKKKIEPAFTVEEEDENLLVDLSDEKKPEVKEITVGDALEYYHDLGLEYNVDYVDASSKNPPKKKPDDLEEDIKDTMNIPTQEDEPVIERTMEIPQEELEQPVEEKPVEEEKPKKEKKVKEEVEEEPEEKVEEKVEEEPKEEEKTVVETEDEVKEEEKAEEEKEETEDQPSATIDDDDNLFDLIDSMYREEDN